jgi:ATP-dependent Clp protease protease subunit
MNHEIFNWTTPMVVENSNSRTVSMDIFSKLLKEQNIIFIGDVITDNMCNIVQAQLLYLSSKDPKAVINVYINSPGGSVHAGLGIWDTLKMIPNPIRTVNTGVCASMAAVLLLAGDPDKRLSLKHARTMIHQPLGGAQGQQSDIEITAQQIKIIREELEDIIIENTTLTKENIKKYTDRDYWMKSDEAKELGFINEIK